MNLKRYVLKTELTVYIYAEDDNDAKIISAQFANNNCNDDQVCKTIELEESPFSSMLTRSVVKGQIRLIDGELFIMP